MALSAFDLESVSPNSSYDRVAVRTCTSQGFSLIEMVDKLGDGMAGSRVRKEAERAAREGDQNTWQV